jgi:hypothetical protein
MTPPQYPSPAAPPSRIGVVNDPLSASTPLGPLSLPDFALVEEACKKSSLLWIAVPGLRDRAVWHVWQEHGGRGAVYLVTGGGEQNVPGLSNGQLVRVTVRSKDKGGRLATWSGLVGRVEPDSAEWAEVVPTLHGKRLNARDGEAQPERWAAHSAIFRIAPQGPLLEGPGRYGRASGAAQVQSGPATTRRAR